MKNRGLLLSILSLLFLTAFTQENDPAKRFNVAWGSPFEFQKKYEDLGFYSNMKDGIIQVSIKQTKDVLIQRFDIDKLRQSSEFNIDLSKMPDHFTPDLFCMLKGNFYMFYSTWDKAKEKEHLFADKIDLVKGRFAEDPQTLIEADKISGDLIATGFYKFSTANKYTFNFSLDSSKLLVSYRKYSAIKNDAAHKDDLGFFVFDDDLNLLWGNEYRMPHTEKMMDNTDYAVDSKGNAYLLCKVYEGKRTEKKGSNPNYHFEILKFVKDSTEAKRIKISFEDKFINDIYLTENTSGEMVCAGYYRSLFKSVNKSTFYSKNVDGVFIARIDDEGEIRGIQKGYYEFPADIVKEFEKRSTQNKIEKKNKKGEAEVPSLELRSLVIGSDGSYVVTGEEFLIQEIIYTSSNGSPRVSITYIYGDIYVMKIGADGEMAWTRKIPKVQFGSESPGGLSFKHFDLNGDNYYFYLDNIKNLKLKPYVPPAKHVDGAGGFFTVCKIDKEGNMTKGNLFDLRQKKVTIWPTGLSRLSPMVMIGRGVSDKKSKLMKVEFNL